MLGTQLGMTVNREVLEEPLCRQHLCKAGFCGFESKSHNARPAGLQLVIFLPWPSKK